MLTNTKVLLVTLARDQFAPASDDKYTPLFAAATNVPPEVAAMEVTEEP
jgi:hypothetical protein